MLLGLLSLGENGNAVGVLEVGILHLSPISFLAPLPRHHWFKRFYATVVVWGETRWHERRLQTLMVVVAGSMESDYEDPIMTVHSSS